MYTVKLVWPSPVFSSPFYIACFRNLYKPYIFVNWSFLVLLVFGLDRLNCTISDVTFENNPSLDFNPFVNYKNGC